MRKTMAWMSILILIPLAACGVIGGNPQPKLPATTPTRSGEQMQTEVSQLLTQMPTSTGQPAGQVTPTATLPAVATETATPVNSAAGQAAPTNTTAPTVAPTAAPTNTTQPQAPTATTAPAAGGGQAATSTASPATATAKPAATTGLSQDDPAKRLGNPTSTDTMDSSYTWNWPTGSDDYSEASFVNGRQVVTALTTKDGWRLANPKGEPFSNLYIETRFDVKDTCHTDVAGMADHYGVIVRVPELHLPNQGYLFSFNCNGQYSLRSWDWNGLDARRQDMQLLIDWTAPKDKDNKNIINSGTRTSNTMGIMTIGSKIRLYANGYFLAEYDYSGNSQIPHLSAGYFGVFVGSRTDTNFTVWVDQMSYWTNPQ